MHYATATTINMCVLQYVLYHRHINLRILVPLLCNTLHGQIKGYHRATNLILPYHQSNIQMLPWKSFTPLGGAFSKCMKIISSILYIVKLNIFDCGIHFLHLKCFIAPFKILTTILKNADSLKHIKTS